LVLLRNGPINVPITLAVNFFENGSLFDPFDLEQVKIYDAAIGGTLLASITPDAYGTGRFRITWDALATSSSLTPGLYFDEWTWTAQSGMPSKTQRYGFELTAAITLPPDPDAPTPPSTETLPVTQTVGCRPKPSWVRNLGLRLVQDVGNGTGVQLAWEEARPSDFNQQVHYNIYFSDTRFNVFSRPSGITTARDVIVNIPVGNVNYFAIKATEFDTDFDISELAQISEDVFQYPPLQTLLNDLPASQDGYVIEVSDVSGYPSTGELLIDTEIIRYSSVDTINNEFVVSVNDRAITLTTLATHDIGTTVEFWKGIEDGNTVIRQGLAAYHQVTPRNVAQIGQVNVDADGYRAANEDVITTDLSASDTNTSDFPNFDFTGYHKPSLQSTFSGDCVNSYVGGEFNGGRGLFFQDRNLARLDAMLQVTGEGVVLLRRKWTGKRCKCIGLRREHARTRCDRCFGTGFDGGYDRFINARGISERFTNAQGFILIRIHPFSDDVKIEGSQGLIQPSELTAWTITFPTLKDRDFIVRFNEDGTEEFRYEVLDVTRNKLLFGQSGKQEFRMRRHDKTDVIYQFDTIIP
jgi:hypothetical protein